MKRALFVFVLAFSAFATNSFADHDGNRFDHRRACDFGQATRLAYRLADIGENFSRSYDYRVASAANNLHHAASSLYYSLRGQGVAMRRFDHNGGVWGASQLQERVRYAVNVFAQVAPYQVGNQVVYLYNAMQNVLYCY